MVFKYLTSIYVFKIKKNFHYMELLPKTGTGVRAYNLTFKNWKSHECRCKVASKFFKIGYHTKAEGLGACLKKSNCLKR